MEIIYRSFDGKEFNSVTECAAYEEKAHKLKMWSANGKTNSVKKAYVVKLDNINDVKIFINRCNSEGDSCVGIGYDEEEPDTVLFAWDVNREEYFYIDDDTLDALVHYLRDEDLI